MVTGSHNPPDYNGFKIGFQGRPFFGEDIQKLGRMSEAGDWEDGIGEVTAADIMDQYVDRLLEGYDGGAFRIAWDTRSEEHTSELQSLMRISYAVFCLKKKNIIKN